MNQRGLIFYTTLIVLGSAMLASRAARQRRSSWTQRLRERVHHAGEGAHLSVQTGSHPDMDTSITSRSIPP